MGARKAKSVVKAGKAVETEDGAQQDAGWQEVTGSEGQFVRALAEARARAASGNWTLQVCNLVPSLAYHNVVMGVAAVVAQATRVKEELPAIDLAAIRRLPEIAAGMVYGARRVDQRPASPGQIKALSARRARSRRKLLDALRSAVSAELVPAAELASIVKGRGPVDAASDCVNMVRIFRKYQAVLKGKTPITAADLREAATVGSQLLTLLRTRGTRRAPNPALVEQTTERDLVFTLLGHGYEPVRQAGHYLFGDDGYDAATPKMGSRLRPKRRPVVEEGGGGGEATEEPEQLEQGSDVQPVAAGGDVVAGTQSNASAAKVEAPAKVAEKPKVAEKAKVAGGKAADRPKAAAKKVAGKGKVAAKGKAAPARKAPRR